MERTTIEQSTQGGERRKKKKNAPLRQTQARAYCSLGSGINARRESSKLKLVPCLEGPWARGGPKRKRQKSQRGGILKNVDNETLSNPAKKGGEGEAHLVNAASGVVGTKNL